MRTNNSNVKNTIVSVYFILVVLAIVMATLSRVFSDITSDSAIAMVLVLVGFTLIFFLVHRVSKYFEYDSDGLNVIILNKGLMLSDNFNYREKRIEFAKDNLLAFKFNNFLFYRTLVIYTSNSRGKKIKDTFNVTLLTKKKRRYIRQSLTKIIKLKHKEL
jgi:hypothetical protein